MGMIMVAMVAGMNVTIFPFPMAVGMIMSVAVMMPVSVLFAIMLMAVYMPMAMLVIVMMFVSEFNFHRCLLIQL